VGDTDSQGAFGAAICKPLTFDSDDEAFKTGSDLIGYAGSYGGDWCEAGEL